MTAPTTLPQRRHRSESKPTRERRAALRAIACLVALEVPSALEPPQAALRVAVIHQAAARATARGFRVATDGEHYYLTYPLPPEPAGVPLGLDLAAVQGPVSEALLVAGRADTLEELVALVDRLSGGG
jgi:hypothetical protein